MYTGIQAKCSILAHISHGILSCFCIAISKWAIFSQSNMTKTVNQVGQPGQCQDFLNIYPNICAHTSLKHGFKNDFWDWNQLGQVLVPVPVPRLVLAVPASSLPIGTGSVPAGSGAFRQVFNTMISNCKYTQFICPNMACINICMHIHVWRYMNICLYMHIFMRVETAAPQTLNDSIHEIAFSGKNKSHKNA